MLLIELLKLEEQFTSFFYVCVTFFEEVFYNIPGLLKNLLLQGSVERDRITLKSILIVYELNLFVYTVCQNACKEINC